LKDKAFSGSLSVDASVDSSLCVRATSSRLETLQGYSVVVDSTELALPDGRTALPAEVRTSIAKGAHLVKVSLASHSCDAISVDVFRAAGTFHYRADGGAGQLAIANVEEEPDVILPQKPATFTASVRVDDSGALARAKLVTEFVVFDVTSCAEVARFGLTTSVITGQTQAISAQWSGATSTGEMLQDGQYLYVLRAALQQDRRNVLSVDSVAKRIRISGQVPAAVCRDKVREDIAASKPQSDPNIDFRNIARILGCDPKGYSACALDFLAHVDVDRRLSAQAQIRSTITPGKYLQLARDRTRKVDIFHKDPSWAPAVCLGDDDADLVPNSRDKCPGTPPLTATDDDGCTDANVPPDDPVMTANLKKRFEAMKLIGDNCPGSPPPTGSQATGVCAAVTPAGLRLNVLKVTNQVPAAGCDVWYLVQGILTPNAGRAPLPVQFAVGKSEFLWETDTEAAYLVPAATLGSDWLQWASLGSVFIESADISIQTLNSSGRRSLRGSLVGLQADMGTCSMTPPAGG
jgi:hypothetical protein